jgi:hypothetical protein
LTTQNVVATKCALNLFEPSYPYAIVKELEPLRSCLLRAESTIPDADVRYRATNTLEWS